MKNLILQELRIFKKQVMQQLYNFQLIGISLLFGLTNVYY